MVSVKLSKCQDFKIGYKGLIFIDFGAKINKIFYWDVFLSQKLLPAVRQKSVECRLRVFGKKSSPAYRAR